jgi:hypothetical protein
MGDFIELQCDRCEALRPHRKMPGGYAFCVFCEAEANAAEDDPGAGASFPAQGRHLDAAQVVTRQCSNCGLRWVSGPGDGMICRSCLSHAAGRARGPGVIDGVIRLAKFIAAATFLVVCGSYVYGVAKDRKRMANAPTYNQPSDPVKRRAIEAIRAGIADDDARVGVIGGGDQVIAIWYSYCSQAAVDRIVFAAGDDMRAAGFVEVWCDDGSHTFKASP